jgi:phosphatidylglycerophosphatase A
VVGESLYAPEAVRSLALALATVGGVGRVPVASGTFGALVALPLMPPLAALRARSPLLYALVLGGIVALAIWSAGRAEEILGGHDHSRIVVDEVAGQLLAGLFVPGTWLATGIAFLFFRLFDVVKPFPAGAIDRRAEGGLGVVGDDLVAGIYAGLATRLVLAFL